MKIGIKKYFSFGILIFCFFSCFCETSLGAEPLFYQKLNQLGISAETLMKQTTLSRYELTRLLNAVQCQDCILPNSSTHNYYNESFWSNFITLPGKDFRDIPYLSGNFQGRNYYYCVANIGEHDTMRGYPLATSNICAGKFCGERNVSKGEFFQTLTNLLTDKVKSNYSAPRKAIKAWLSKKDKQSYEYRAFTTEELGLIDHKSGSTEKITTRPEFTAYLKYCMFNPYECGFQTFETIGKGVWPLSELNILIQAGIITAQDTKNLSSAIHPKEALEKLNLLYDLHTQCEINTDYDCDGVSNHEDNCPYTYNPSQNDLDGYGIGDVCDDDIDGDGLKNPVGLVDDTGNINYGLLKHQKSEDPTPFGEQKGEDSYSIKVISLSKGLPALAKFELISQEKPASVERDFGDLTSGKGVTTQHSYSSAGLKTITAKITLNGGQSFLLSQQIKIGSTQESAYALNIKILELNNQAKTAKFQAEFQGKFDSFERGNTANGNIKKLSSLSPFTTSLEMGKRNNITLKGYAEGKLVAVASLDVLDQNGKFFSFSPKHTPLLKTVDNKISTTLLLSNLSLSTIETVKWDFGDGTNFSDKKLANNHSYPEAGAKILIQKILLKNGQELISSSTLTVTNPEEFGNQAFNLMINRQQNDLALGLQALEEINPDTISLQTFTNGRAIFSNEKVSFDKPFFTLSQKQGLIKIKNKILVNSTTLFENEAIAFLSGKNIGISFDTDQIFSGLKCDMDQDGIPDLYDDDIDGDGIKNLLGMMLYEKADCKLVIGENIDEKLYQQHFGVCSLDNCPLALNKNQTDLNLNGIGDQCEESSGFCGDKKIGPGENCLNCPQDVGECTTSCGNGKIDAGEDCKNCPQDLKDLCIDEGDKSSCGNGKIDSGETCINCPQDVPNCDRDEDGCPDVNDPCPNLPGINGCCPELPAPCEGEECPLVNPVCNQCPCHYADYSNTLQKNDQVRARLRDQRLNIHYNYTPFVGIKDFLKQEK